MSRRLVITTCLLGVVVASTGAAMASPGAPVNDRNHSICVLVADHQDYNGSQYYCVGLP